MLVKGNLYFKVATSTTKYFENYGHRERGFRFRPNRIFIRESKISRKVQFVKGSFELFFSHITGVIHPLYYK